MSSDEGVKMAGVEAEKVLEEEVPVDPPVDGLASGDGSTKGEKKVGMGSRNASEDGRAQSALFMNILPRMGSLGRDSPPDLEKVLESVNMELLQLRQSAQDRLRKTEERVQDGMKKTEEALIARLREMEKSFKEAQHKLAEGKPFKDAEERIRDTQVILAEGIRETQERIKDAQSQLREWQERTIKPFFEPVPLRIPFERRMQTLAVMLWSFFFIFPGMFIFYMVFAGLILNQYTALLMLPYFLFTLTFDSASAYDARNFPFMRGWGIWKHMANFFPCSLEKTADLDPEKRYVFGVHPHGVISIGAFINFATEGTHFSKHFPGVKPYLCTLESNFSIPLAREVLLGLGIVAASRRSFRTLCASEMDSTKGNAVAVVVGGAAEALESSPGDYTLVLGKRKGFVRMALETGACLVPVISFGENSLYNTVENPEGSSLRKFQEVMKKVSGVAPVIFYGRGAFNYAFGFLPFRRPLVTVVGSPIEVPKYMGENIYTDPEAIKMTNEYHNQYIRALSRLFDENVHRYDATFKSFKVN